MSQYYRLKEKYLLRGWKQVPWALVDRETGAVWYLIRKAFEVIELADGTLDFLSSDISQKQRAIAQKLVKMGYLEKLDQPESIQEIQRYTVHPNQFISNVQCHYRPLQFSLQALSSLFPSD